MKHLGASRAAAVAKARKPNGGAVTTDDLRVEISYFGAAKGRWSPRGFTPDEQPLETWGEQTGDLYVNADVCFANVPQRMWTFELGGYPVLKKWLGYRHVERREGAPITLAEQRHFRSMVQRLATLLAMAASLDSGYVRASSAAFTGEGLGVR